MTLLWCFYYTTFSSGFFKFSYLITVYLCQVGPLHCRFNRRYIIFLIWFINQQLLDQYRDDSDLIQISSVQKQSLQGSEENSRGHHLVLHLDKNTIVDYMELHKTNEYEFVKRIWGNLKHWSIDIPYFTQCIFVNQNIMNSKAILE